MQIYKITNLINNKIYIGKDTTSDPNYFGSGLLINRSLKKYGIENFIKEIIDETDDYQELSKKEIYWIDKYNSSDRKIGYNISKGGDGGDTLSNHPDLDLIKEKISKNNPKTGKTYEKAFGIDFANSYKAKLRKNIHKNILSEESKLKNRKKWEEYNNKFKERCEFIKHEIDKGNLNEFIDELKLIKKLVYNNFLKNTEGFYNFFGKKLKYKICSSKIDREEELSLIKEHICSNNFEPIIDYIKKSIPNSIFKSRSEFYLYFGPDVKEKIRSKLYLKRKKYNSEKSNYNNSLKVQILIDNIEYNSISEASKKLNIDRKIISYRLKSSHFKNYLYKDNDINTKNKKFIDIVPHLSKKERISIDGIIYESITNATKFLNKTHDYITWRLNSNSYTNWFYLDKVVELKETGKPKMKKVSILGYEYNSITEAVEKSGIDRQVMRYRLKSKNYPEYFYI